MKYIATVLLVLMSITFVVCGILLWKRRKELDDHSRTIQAVFSWLSALFSTMFIFRTWAGTTTADGVFFEPEHTFIPIFIQMCFFFYPLEVIQPTISRSKVYALLFSPLLLLVLIGMCAGIEYTPIYTYSDLWSHIGEFNVWFRLFALTMMLFYCFTLLLVPYDMRKSSANEHHIRIYASGFCLIGLLHFAIQITHNYWIVLAHQVVWMAFFVLITYFELRERQLPPKSSTMFETKRVPVSEEKGLWDRIITALDDEEKWRDAGLNLNTLSDYMNSNRTYVGDAVKQNTGLTFNEYINQRRVNYIVEQLKHNPEASLSKLFDFVGYTQRTTAIRNFQKITGVTPAEFIEGIRQQKGTKFS